MKQVFQRFCNTQNGDCMKAALCSLLELEYDDVPNFVEHEDWWEMMNGILKEHGYQWGKTFYNDKVADLRNPNDCFKPYAELCPGFSLDDISDEDSAGGLLFGSVFSPHFFDFKDAWNQHMVIIDTNCNIVFDPSPEYQNIHHYPFARLIGHNGIDEAWGLRKFNK